MTEFPIFKLTYLVFDSCRLEFFKLYSLESLSAKTIGETFPKLEKLKLTLVNSLQRFVLMLKKFIEVALFLDDSNYDLGKFTYRLDDAYFEGNTLDYSSQLYIDLLRKLGELDKPNPENKFRYYHVNEYRSPCFVFLLLILLVVVESGRSSNTFQFQNSNLMTLIYPVSMSSPQNQTKAHRVNSWNASIPLPLILIPTRLKA